MSAATAHRAAGGAEGSEALETGRCRSAVCNSSAVGNGNRDM